MHSKKHSQVPYKGAVFTWPQPPVSFHAKATFCTAPSNNSFSFTQASLISLYFLVHSVHFCNSLISQDVNYGAI